MAFDGITIANIVYDLNRTILNGRIAKIAQPEKDELILTIKGGNVGQARLLLSASASLPLIYLTDTNKPSPMKCTEFLYAFTQTYCKRTDHEDFPTGNGAYCTL